jgi:hypothetical protein
VAYTDGTTATGVPPLPAQSPDQQAAQGEPAAPDAQAPVSSEASGAPADSASSAEPVSPSTGEAEKPARRQPQVGDRVYFFGSPMIQGHGFISHVWSDTCVNLSLNDGSAPTSVLLVQDGDQVPSGHYCTFDDAAGDLQVNDTQAAAVDETHGAAQMGFVGHPPEVAQAPVVEAKQLSGDELARHAHNLWCNDQIANGWAYGPTLDEANRTHPNLVNFDLLPQQVKDAYTAGAAL